VWGAKIQVSRSERAVLQARRVNAPHRPDLLLHYETSQTGIDPGDTRACLTGKTFGNVSIEGCDSIRTLKLSYHGR
jgi:hypothetical protein